VATGYHPHVVGRILRNVIWLGFGEAFVKGGLFVATVVIARSAGPAGVGTFSIAYSAALIAVLVLALGQQEVLIREVARCPEGARPLVSASQLAQARLARWLVPLAAIGVLLVGDRELRLALLTFVPYALLRTATVTVGAAFKGLDRMDVEARARAFEVGIAVVLIGVVAIVGWPAWSVGIAFSAGSAVGLMWLFARSRGLTGECSVPGSGLLLQEGIPFMALAVVSQLLVHADRFLLAFFGVNTGDIGLWGACGTVVWALLALPQLMTLALYPSFSRIAESGAPPRTFGLVAGAVGGAVGLTFTFALRWVAEPLIDVVFGPEFAPAVPLLRQLAWALPGAFGLMTMGGAYAGWRRQTVSLGIMVAAFCLSAALNVLWIPSMGVAAPAAVAPLAYSAAAVVSAVVVAFLRARDLGAG
jgi:O-antigen/teichoic acid export membrane protein